MATRQEIGLSSFNAAQALYEQSHFRSSVRRSYYAAFSLLTHEPPPYLEPHQPSNYRLNVSETGLRHSRDDWWKVVVQPDREGVRSHDYYGRLAEAEGDIEDHEDLKVSLVPALPG